MAAIGLTGGPGCGKSLTARLLGEALPALCFDADAAVRRCMDQNAEAQQAIASLMGVGAFTNQPEERRQLREQALGDPGFRERLEAILHPRIRSEWLQEAQNRWGDSSQHFVAEIPLLYEKSLSTHFECVIVVAAGDSVQQHRLRQRHLDDRTIRQFLSAQMSLAD